jgi:ParB family transcriptional regulator, chromosome partitioning protein
MAKASTPQRGLGKGLGALIPREAAPQALTGTSTPLAGGFKVEPAGMGAVYAELPVDLIAPNPRQPRTVFDEEALAELVYSIKEIGLLQPVVVRRSIDGYELIAGERRLRASKLAGLLEIPAIIRDTEDIDLLRDALLENLHRANLNALEEAAAYEQLLADFGCTQEELARRIGRSRPQVTNTLRLLRLPASVQRRVAAGVLSAGHARALLSLATPEAMDVLAQRIVAEGLSVRSVEELILLGDGDGQKRERKPRASKPRADSVADLIDEAQRRLGEGLDTRVHVEGLPRANSRGKIVIEVADVEDLRRIADLISGTRQA